MEFTSKKSSEEKLRDLINQKKNIKERHQKEKLDLENKVKLLEKDLEKDLDFEEYKEAKDKYEFYKNKLDKFLKIKEPVTVNLEQEIEKEFSLRRKEIEEEHEKKANAAYENLKASLEALALLLDERNELGVKLNQSVLNESDLNGNKLRLEPINGIKNGNIRIHRDNWGRPVIEYFQGRSSGFVTVRI